MTSDGNHLKDAFLSAFINHHLNKIKKYPIHSINNFLKSQVKLQ